MPEDTDLIEKKPLTGGSSDAAAKKKKMIIGGVVGVAVLALILILIFALGGGGGGDNGGGGDAPVGPGYNPYKVDDDSFTQTVDEVTGVLNANSDVKEQLTQRKAFLDKNKVKLLGDEAPKVDLVDPSSIAVGANNEIVKKIRFEVGQVDYTLAKLRLTDDENSRWSPPEEYVKRRDSSATMRPDMSGFSLDKDPFGIEFKDSRTSDGELYVSTKGQSLLLMDKYMQMDFKIPSQRLYGLGERNREFQLTEGTWTMWANGQETPYDDGTGGLQTYGVHPFLLFQTGKKGNFAGMYFRNSNAQSPVIKYNDDGTSTFSYITTGGEIEVYFFFKGSAIDIIKQYQNFVGLPSLPPLWSLGWHAASYGYKTLADVQANEKGYADAGIPLEGIWLDIPYMNNYADFTVDPKDWKDLLKYTQTIQEAGKKMIVIVDGGISAEQGSPAYKYFNDARQKGALIKSAISEGTSYLGDALSTVVWPNHTVFLDFLNQEGVEIWKQGLTDLFEQVPFDGLWLDMNEITGFCNGECPDGPAPDPDEPEEQKKRKLRVTILDSDSLEDGENWYQSYPQDDESTYYLPFIPGKYNLDNMTMSLNATHPESGFRQYDTHSLFGLIETNVTHQWLAEESANKGKRPFILSRSTFSGSGQHTAHWLGDNHREWSNMNYSISGVMNFNMFGIPMVGPDVCGFFEASSAAVKKQAQELCGRWFQLSTYYPFARQHRDKADVDGGRGGEATEPYTLPEVQQNWAKDAIKQRLTMVRHLYTCLFNVHKNGGTCFDPLIFHYPNDDGVYEQVEHQFIMGDAFKVAPVLKTKVKTHKAYFPAGRWVNVHNYGDVVDVPCPDDNKECYGSYGKWMTLKTDPNNKDDKIASHFVPGSIAFFQEGDFMLTKDLEGVPITMVVNRDHNGHAGGNLFLDDGESLETLEKNQYEFHNFQVSANSIKKWVQNEAADQAYGQDLAKIVLTDAEDLKNTNFACVSSMADNSLTPLKFSFDEKLKTLTLSKDGGSIETFTMRDIFFGDSKTDINMCNIATDYYHTKDYESILLTKNSASAVLQTSSEALHDLKLTMKVLKTGVLNVKYTYNSAKAPSRPVFEVPKDIVDGGSTLLKDAMLSDYVSVTQNKNKPLQISVLSKDKVPLYDLNGFVMSEYYNYISSTVHVEGGDNFKGIMGLGEQITSDLFVSDGVYSFWSRDQPDPESDGKAPGKNAYGTHPFYMAKDSKGKWFGVFHNLAAGQDWWVKNSGADGKVDLQTISIGGLTDIYFMFGNTPNEIIKTYQTIIGKPVLTPQWALGWNQCRWGYRNTAALAEVVGNYSKYGIPLDTQWSDIDYLDQYRDFTFDQNNFGDLNGFIADLHDNKHMHYIPIIDAGLAQRADGYDAYKEGADQGNYLTAPNGEPFTGRVWPGDAVYPDLTKDSAPDWWKGQLSKLHDQIPFDGLWLDMNEASNFCNGYCDAHQGPDFPSKHKLPYVPSGRDLETKSIALDVKHSDGNIELDYHSLFGTQEVKTTHDWFTQNQMRPMIIERSAYAGLGKYGSRWLGDNFSSAKYMGHSVVGVMQHNMFGIPLAGSDICGFIDNTSPDLCARWHVIGAFYPFSRNHNNWGQDSQEPWEFIQDLYEDTISYMDIIKMAIQQKYSMIRYYYTQLGLLNKDGGAFYKPLFFEFPDDQGAYENPQYNVMLGEAMKVSFLSDYNGTDPAKDTTDFYFPEGVTWCNVVKKTEKCFKPAAGEGKKTLGSKAYDFHLHLREGYIVPMQDARGLKIMNSYELQQHPVDFLINAACTADKCDAQGMYLNDDGVTMDIDGDDNQRNIYSLTLSGKPGEINVAIEKQMKSKAENSHVNKNDAFNTIQLYNADAQGFNGDTISVTVIREDGQKVIDKGHAIYDKKHDMLTWTAPTDKDENLLWLPDIKSIEFKKV